MRCASALIASVATERLLLRRPVAADLARFCAIHGDPHANLFNPAGPMATATAQQAFAAWLKHWDEHGYGQWTVAARAAPEYVIGFGGLALRAYGGMDRVNLGYRFAPAAWGHGYATELAEAARDTGLGAPGLQEVFGLVRPAHTASIRVLEKIGMRLVDLLDDVPGAAPSLVYVVAR